MAATAAAYAVEYAKSNRCDPRVPMRVEASRRGARAIGRAPNGRGAAPRVAPATARSRKTACEWHAWCRAAGSMALKPSGTMRVCSQRSCEMSTWFRAMMAIGRRRLAGCFFVKKRAFTARSATDIDGRPQAPAPLLPHGGPSAFRVEARALCLVLGQALNAFAPTIKSGFWPTFRSHAFEALGTPLPHLHTRTHTPPAHLRGGLFFPGVCVVSRDRLQPLVVPLRRTPRVAPVHIAAPRQPGDPCHGCAVITTLQVENAVPL
jgi:hypothetical protein